ncbi:ribonuclease VapC [Thermus composti]|uniref:Ribonuclease VapC n=1 Tax=Thermus composti TaxID=532059 RepID=A0ABV6Q1P7_9DEIN|nr:type II toxin-antitoxin system VapC family toxin [Thermus composti]GGN01259.1 ribonuclease VapC [Thermus composti]
MFVDASALLAILLREPDYPIYLEAIEKNPGAKVGAPTLAEAAIAFGRKVGFEHVHLVEDLVRFLGLEIVPFTESHFREAVRAYARYGKGRHPARLNLGDCLSYALARAEGEPLLYKGQDFDQTDLAWKPS